MEKELDRLESSGIITKVEHSQWATPIVGSSLCFPVPMFPGTYVSRYLCSPVPMFPSTYVPRSSVNLLNSVLFYSCEKNVHFLSKYPIFTLFPIVFSSIFADWDIVNHIEPFPA